MAQALQGVVVQIDVGQLHRRVRDGLQIHREAVILGGDFHSPGELALYRLISAPVPELQLLGLALGGRTFSTA